MVYRDGPYSEIIQASTLPCLDPASARQGARQGGAAAGSSASDNTDFNPVFGTRSPPYGSQPSATFIPILFGGRSSFGTNTTMPSGVTVLDLKVFRFC